jgi:hypothetical protein
MHKYRVVELQTEKGLCALQCNLGRYHLIRALGRAPGLDMRLVGDKPHLGFGILRCTASGALFRVIFETINERPPVPAPGRLAVSPAPGQGDAARSAQSSAALPPAADAALTMVPQTMSISDRRQGQSRSVARLARS